MEVEDTELVARLAKRGAVTIHLRLDEQILPDAESANVIGELPGTARGQRATKAFAVLTGGRRLEIIFPDFRQPADPADRTKPGNQVQLRPVEMRNALKYEILLAPAK